MYPEALCYCGPDKLPTRMYVKSWKKALNTVLHYGQKGLLKTHNLSYLINTYEESTLNVLYKVGDITDGIINNDK